jgi:hypothetical protein
VAPHHTPLCFTTEIWSAAETSAARLGGVSKAERRQNRGTPKSTGRKSASPGIPSSTVNFEGPDARRSESVLCTGLAAPASGPIRTRFEGDSASPASTQPLLLEAHMLPIADYSNQILMSAAGPKIIESLEYWGDGDRGRPTDETIDNITPAVIWMLFWCAFRV